MPIRIVAADGPKRKGKITGGRGLGGGPRKKRKPSMSPGDLKRKGKGITITGNRIPKGTKVFAGADEKIHKKPHATKEGSWASIKRAGKRFKEGTYKIGDYGDKSLDIQWKAENKARKKYNIGGRANLLEEMGRIDARKHSDAADRAEKRRVIRELNKGYKSGGAVLKGKKVGIQIK